jgi:cbb3-type cytochrome oxidase subunit 3
MNDSIWTFPLYTLMLAAVFAGIIVYYFNPKRKGKVEGPKHNMLKDDD